MSAESQWAGLFETMMQQSPVAMLPFGHSLALQGDVDALAHWMKAIGSHNWKGLMVDDINNVAPLAIPLIGDGASKSASVSLNPAAVVAIALNANATLVRDNAPLAESEHLLVQSYLNAAKGHKFERHLHTELLWAVCSYCDRGAAVTAALSTGPDLTLKSLYNTQKERGMYQLDTVFGVSLKSRDSARPNAFLALCESLGPPCFLDESDEIGIDFSGLLGGIRGSSTYSPGPKIWQQLLASADPAPALAALLQIEQRAPSKSYDDHRSLQHGRATVVAHHVMHAAENGLAWSAEVVDFLLGRTSQYSGPSGTTVEQSKSICDAIKIGGGHFGDQGGRDVAFQIQMGLAAHCKPLLEHCLDHLRELQKSPKHLQLSSQSLIPPTQNAKDPDDYPLPLSFVIRGISNKQVVVESRLTEVVELLESTGLLDAERQPNRKTAMHYLASAPVEQKAEWFFRLTNLGLDPEGCDAKGAKPAARIKDKDEKAEWQNYIRLVKAREAARDAVSEIDFRP